MGFKLERIDARPLLKESDRQVKQLEKYLRLIDEVQKVDVSKNQRFQKAYCSFYRFRESREIQDIYLEYFEEEKSDPKGYETIIREITKRIEAKLGKKKVRVLSSFSSKLLATINPLIAQYGIKMCLKC